MIPNPETRVGELLAAHPAVVEVFAAFHLGDSRGEFLPRAYTLRALAEERGVPLEMLLVALGAWLEENEPRAVP